MECPLLRKRQKRGQATLELLIGRVSANHEQVGRSASMMAALVCCSPRVSSRNHRLLCSLATQEANALNYTWLVPVWWLSATKSRPASSHVTPPSLSIKSHSKQRSSAYPCPPRKCITNDVVFSKCGLQLNSSTSLYNETASVYQGGALQVVKAGRRYISDLTSTGYMAFG